MITPLLGLKVGKNHMIPVTPCPKNNDKRCETVGLSQYSPSLSLRGSFKCCRHISPRLRRDTGPVVGGNVPIRWFSHQQESTDMKKLKLRHVGFSMTIIIVQLLCSIPGNNIDYITL